MPGATEPLKLLVVDDEAAMREVLEMRLGEMGHEVHLAESGGAARELAREVRPDAVISDVVLPDLDGIELLELLKSGDPDRPVILITAYGSVDSAVEALKLGAQDFLTKPLDYGKLQAVLEEVRGEIARRRTRRELEARLDGDHGLGPLIGRSSKMRQAFELLEMIAGSDASAILTGESGTGKELAARVIHDLSRRSSAPFVAVNTATIPASVSGSELFGHEKGAFTGAVRSRPGFFEQADGGTLFLDEIGEMPASIQAELLRVVEDGVLRRIGSRRETRVDVRVLAATNRNPNRAVEEGRLREDLYYRLSVFTVELPPLRDRLDDLPLLVQHFIRDLDAKHGTAVEGAGDEALERLSAYGWPGNVRELRNALERAVIVAQRGWLEPVHLPPFIRDGPGGGAGTVQVPAGSTVAEAERLLILDTLRRHEENKTRAARELGIDVKTLRNKLRAYAEQG